METFDSDYGNRDQGQSSPAKPHFTPTTSSPDRLRVRCPECFKPYNIEVAEIREAKPRFECVSCRSQFWIDFAEALNHPSDIIGFLVSSTQRVKRGDVGQTLESQGASQKLEAKVVDQKLGPKSSPNASTQLRASGRNASDKSKLNNEEIYNCPKCNSGYGPGESECKKCGLVFLKFEEHLENAEKRRREEALFVSKEVRQLWDDVLSDYDNGEAHQNFINAAWADGSLEYAALKYRTILEVVAQDEMALKFQKEIQALAVLRFEVAASEAEAKSAIAVKQFVFFKGLDFSFRKFKWINLILIACGFLIVMGMLLPHMRNLVGFGTSVLFFILALRYYFRVI